MSDYYAARCERCAGWHVHRSHRLGAECLGMRCQTHGGAAVAAAQLDAAHASLERAGVVAPDLQAIRDEMDRDEVRP